jgi:hypothetical protein
MNPNRRTEKKSRRRRKACIASAAAVTILSTITLPQHAVVLATTASTSEAGHQEEEMTTSSDHHRQRKLTEHRRRMAEQRRRLQEQWTVEAIQNLQTLDYVLDESDTSNNPRYFIRSRDGRLHPPSALHMEENIVSVEEDDDESTGEEGTGNTEVVHHQKSRLGPTNNGHLHTMGQFQHWQSGERNLRGGSMLQEGEDGDAFPEDLDEIPFIYDEDDPEEEDLDGYELVYAGNQGNQDDSHLYPQEQRKLSLADEFVSSTANSFVNSAKEDPKGKGDGQLLPFGKKAQIFNQVFPSSGSTIGNIQAFGAQVLDASIMKSVKIQFKDESGKRSKWKKLPKDKDLEHWFMREMSGFPPGKKWKYRMKAKDNSKKKEMTMWMELAIDIERVEETPPPTSLPTPNPTPGPSPSPTSPPSSQPSPGRTSPPSAPPTPAPTMGPTSPPTMRPTSPPTPRPSPYPVDYTSQWTRHPTRYPTTDSPTDKPTDHPTSHPSNHPTSPPTSNPTEPPTNYPTDPPTSQPTEPPTPLPTSPPTQEATEAVQQAPPQLLTRHVRDDPWEYGGKCY